MEQNQNAHYLRASHERSVPVSRCCGEVRQGAPDGTDAQAASMRAHMHARARVSFAKRCDEQFFTALPPVAGRLSLHRSMTYTLYNIQTNIE